jgi:hypothetical protein
MNTTPEDVRLQQDRERIQYWKRWGPYLSERAWGTVREDYSPGGTAWESLPHDHARSRAYRWNEDGLAGICDRHQRICFAIALWNRRDPILKERLFGLTGSEGNHGEDVKEYYFYTDSTPTHSYMRYLYKYPQAAFPYSELVEENRRRGKQAPEFELADTGVFDESRYFDVEVEYAKADPEDILIRIRITNCGPDAAPIDVLPTVWFRNIWSWYENPSCPSLARGVEPNTIALEDPKYGQRYLHCDDTVRLKADATSEVEPTLVFTENETNNQRLFGSPNSSPYVKDAFHRPRRARHQGGGALLLLAGRWRVAHAAAAAEPAGPARIRARLRRRLRRPHRRSRRVLPDDHPGHVVRRCEERRAAGVRRPPLVEAVLPLRRQTMARRRRGAAGAAVRSAARPQSRVDSSL